MGRILRAVVLGIGMLFGIIRPETPAVSCRIYRDDAAVFLNAEVSGAFPEEALKLLESGNELDLVFTITADVPGEWVLPHSLRFDPLSGTYEVGIAETGGVHRTDSREVALSIAGRVTGLRVLAVGDFDAERGLSVALSCTLRSPGMDAAAIWNYGTPETHVRFTALSGIPR